MTPRQYRRKEYMADMYNNIQNTISIIHPHLPYTTTRRYELSAGQLPIFVCYVKNWQ